MSWTLAQEDKEDAVTHSSPAGDALTEPMNTVGSLSLAHLADVVAREAPTPGGGAQDPVTFSDLVQRADTLRARFLSFADEDAQAYGQYIAVSELSPTPNPEIRAAAVRAALDAAAEVPLNVARSAVELAAIGEQLALFGNPRLRPDACVAVLLAAAVARGAAILVAENLPERGDDPKMAEAKHCVAKVSAAAQTSMALFENPQERTSP